MGKCLGWVITATAAEAGTLLVAFRSASPGVWLYSDSARAIEALERLRYGLMPPVTADIYPVFALVKPMIDGAMLVRLAHATDNAPLGAASAKCVGARSGRAA